MMELLLGHLVGDYLFQTDWMAQHKRNWWLPCALHVLLYCWAVWLFTGWGTVPLAVTFVAHYLQDRYGLARTFMRHTNHEQFATGPLAPWSIIVTDNTLHLVQLWLTELWLRG